MYEATGQYREQSTVLSAELSTVQPTEQSTAWSTVQPTRNL